MQGLMQHDFKSASVALLKFLHQRYGFDLWMVTRTNGSDWIVLEANDHGYNVREGMSFIWEDSFCSRMVKDLGPKIAPRSEEVPAYLEAPIGKKVPIKAYIGLPIKDQNNQLFGTLCAIDPNTQSDSIKQDEPLLEMFASMLSTILSLELDVNDKIRRDKRELALSEIDTVSQVYNWRAWENLLDVEEVSCRLYGNLGDLIVIHLCDIKKIINDQGPQARDALLLKTATILKKHMREQDVIARVDHEGFAILSIDHPEGGSPAFADKIMQALQAESIEIAIGYARSQPSKGLRMALEVAEHNMYKNKSIRKSAA